MKDLPLSVLSRGCGQIVPCEGRQHGRLDVCFTPEDYYIWKTHGPLLRLSNSGSKLTEPEPTLPKTYSTRRGALLLYSQGLVTWKTCPSHAFEGKYYGQYGAQTVQQKEQSIENTSKESILKYTAGLERNHGLPTTLPPLYHPQPPPEYFGTLLCQEEPTSKQQIQPLALSAERKHAEERKRTLDVHLPPITTASSPQTQHHSLDNAEAFTISENPKRTGVEQTGQAEEAHVSSGAYSRESNTKSRYDQYRVSDEKASSNYPHTRQRDQSGGLELKESKMAPGVILPPLKTGQSVSHESRPLFLNRVARKEPYVERLPPIDECGGLSHKTQDSKPVKNPDRLQQPLFLPLLGPENCEEENIQKKNKEKFVNQDNCQTLSQRVREGQNCDNIINFTLSKEEECTAPLWLLTGRRGPGHQSSLAFLRKVSEEPSDIRDVVRGLLPLELRDLNGQAVGSLILGPDGEIIQLSMLDNIQDNPEGQALEVLSTQGEKLPWVVVLQPEHQLTEGNKEDFLQRFNIQTEPFSSEPSDLQRPQGADTAPIKAHSEAMNSTDHNDTKSIIKTSVMNPLEEGENTVLHSSGLNGTDVEKPFRDDKSTVDKKDPGSGQLSHLPQENVSTNQPNEVSTRNNSPNYAAELQSTKRDSKKINKLKSTEERPIADKGKIKNIRTSPKHQIASSKENQERTSKTGQIHDKDKTLAANTAKMARSKEVKTRDIKKTHDKTRESRDQAQEASSEGSQKTRKGQLKHKDMKSEETSDQLTSPSISSSQETEEELRKHRRNDLSAKQKHSTGSDITQDDPDRDRVSVKELRLNSSTHSQSVRSLWSSASGSTLKHSSSRKSTSLSSEGRTPGGSTAPLSLSRSCLSSCSTVMIPEESLMLNPVKAEVAVAEQTQEDNDAALEAERAMIQKQEEEERKKREQEEEMQKRQQQREEVEQLMKNQLQNERQRRAEEIRLKKQAEEEERRQREEEQQRTEQKQREQREREIRRQQEKKRQMEYFQKKRQEEEQRRKAELERLQLLEEKKLQEEKTKLQEMNESERAEYLRKKMEEDVIRQREEDERRRREEEAALLAAEKAKREEELLAREMALLHQRLSFKRGLMVESEGLEKSQGISRPWTYSYFTLLQMLGLSTTGVPNT